MNSTSREKWNQILQEHATSGLSVREFCEQRGFTPQSYYQWRRLLHEGEPRTFASNGLNQTNGLTLRIGKAEIEVRQGFDEKLLLSVIKALSSS